MLAAADADLARRDRALPGLAVVLDSDAVAEAVRAPAPPRPAYVRYKPGTSCLVGYRLPGETTGLQIIATCYRFDAGAKLRKARERAAAPGPWGPGRLVLERHGVVVSFFPNDDDLAVLPRLAGEVERGRLFRKLFPQRPELWPASFRPLAYKPSRRFVVAVCIDGTPRGVLKAYTGPGFLVAGGAGTVRSGRVLRTARRIGRSARHGLLAWDWLPGHLLSDQMRSPDFRAGLVAPVGAALAETHAQKPRRLPPRTRDREAEALAASADWIAAVSPDLGQRARRLAVHLAELLRNRPEVRRTVHGDFYPKQVLVHGDTVSVLDFDEAGAGDPAFDLGLFLAHLERAVLRGDLASDRVGRVRAAILDGYRQEAGALPGGIDLYTAAGLVRIAPHAFRNRDPDWPERTAAQLDRAEAVAHALAPAVARSGTDVSVHDPFGVADDPAMPFVAAALDPFEAGRRLRECWRTSGAAGQVRLRAIRVTRHKPGRRCLIEYDLDSEDTESPITLVGKARAKGADLNTDAVLRAFRAAGLRDDAGDVCVPEPVGVIAEFRMSVQRGAAGERVGGRLADGGPGLAGRIAEAAHRIHSAGVPSARSHTSDDELRVLRERLSALAAERPGWASRLGRLLDGCGRLADRLPTVEARGIHRDFYPDQLLVHGPRVYVLDFDLYCLGDPALDVGNFLGHVTEFALRSLGRADGLREHETALEERFLGLSGTHRGSAVRAYATLTLVRHVSISTQFPDRRAFTEALLELCEDRLARAGVLPRAHSTAVVPCALGGSRLRGDRS